MVSERPDQKRMRLRYAGACRLCAVEVAQGVTAVYERQTRSVLCLGCADLGPLEEGTTSPSLASDASPALDMIGAARVFETVATLPPEAEISYTQGAAGLSARREHDRRHAKREDRIRAAHPKLGGLILALSDDPQSTNAWARGAVGEELLGGRLDAMAGPLVRVMHDRRIPRSKANLDHIAVCPSGVFVIDAKRYRGRPTLRVEGGILRPRVAKLMVGRRDCTKLVDGVLKQVALVADATSAKHPEVPVLGMLCFVDADWPLIGGSFSVRDVFVGWPKKAAARLQEDGSFDEGAIASVARTIAAAFPPA